jgi:hypothetical protein
MAHIDLNQLRAARAEQKREPYTITIGDPAETFTIPHQRDWPVEVGEFLGVGNMRMAMQVLVGKQWEQMKTHSLTIGDIEDLMEAIMNSNGVAELGEALASNGSSPTISGPSKATSNGSTPSTSARRSRQAKAGSPPAASPT